MKRMIISVLALTMVFSVCAVPAFATTDTIGAVGDKSIDVKAVYSSDVDVPDVYSVDIEWGAMEFTYTESGTKTWDPESKQYEINTDTEWTAEGNGITVTNHSNKAVTAEFEFTALSDYSTVTGSFSNASVSLASADKESVTAAELTGTTALTLGGTLATSVETLTKVGTITVTIE